MKVLAHPDSELTDVELRELNDLLTEKRQQVAVELEDLREQVVIKRDCSLLDASDVATNREQLVRIEGLAVIKKSNDC